MAAIGRAGRIRAHEDLARSDALRLMARRTGIQRQPSGGSPGGRPAPSGARLPKRPRTPTIKVLERSSYRRSLAANAKPRSISSDRN